MPDGTIRTIRPDRDDGRGFGLIAPDSGGPDLLFTSGSAEGAWSGLRRAVHNLRHPDDRRGSPFGHLHVGQRVAFAVGVEGEQAGRPSAGRVRPLMASPPPSAIS